MLCACQNPSATPITENTTASNRSLFRSESDSGVGRFSIEVNEVISTPRSISLRWNTGYCDHRCRERRIPLRIFGGEWRVRSWHLPGDGLKWMTERPQNLDNGPDERVRYNVRHDYPIPFDSNIKSQADRHNRARVTRSFQQDGFAPQRNREAKEYPEGSNEKTYKAPQSDSAFHTPTSHWPICYASPVILSARFLWPESS
jgi:hypothetical protein